MPGTTLKLLQLPEELLLRVFQSLPETQLLVTLPLVCTAFVRLLRLHSPCWAHISFHDMFDTVTCSIEAAAFCKWLQPRAAHMEALTFPVDAYLTRDKTCFTRELLAVLPDSLRELKLQELGTDHTYKAAVQETSHLEMFSHLQQGFQPLQDTVLHLSSLTRLSQLQELSLPLHAPIDKQDLESLGSDPCTSYIWNGDTQLRMAAPNFSSCLQPSCPMPACPC